MCALMCVWLVFPRITHLYHKVVSEPLLPQQNRSWYCMRVVSVYRLVSEVVVSWSLCGTYVQEA